MGIRGKGSLDRLRTIWTPEMDRYFIDLMLEQLNKGNRFDDHVFSKTAWVNMNSSFNEKFKFDYEMDVLKNRHKTLRNVYKAVKNLLNQKGFSWDATRQMVVAESKIWDEYVKVNPDVRPYRLKSLPYYDDLCVIYGDNLAGKMGYSVPETSSHLGEDKEGSAARLECGDDGTVEAVHEIVLGEECVSVPLEVMDASESTPIATANPPYGRNRMYWQPPMDRFFIDLMLEQVHNGNQIDGVFCKQAWIEMIASFNAKFGSNYDMDILKNRLKTLRRQYNVIKNILQLDGFAWDDERQMVTADDSVWQDYIKGHKDARQFMTRPVPYYKDLCLICSSPDNSDCFALQCSEPENVDREVKPLQAPKFSQSPVASVSSEGEIGYLLEPACLDSNTTGSNHNYKRQLENKSSSVHSKKLRSEYDSMASVLREMASAVSSLTEKKDDGNSNPISIESVVTAVQALPDMDEDFILDACDFLEDEIKAKTFMALDVKLRKKWLLRKLCPPQ
ncbi:two-component response regulator ARR2-like [Hibiscus syriacus]|uniref:Two-component response regulator ARR2-like n=1 Tax=Hibiscus syriacus TaxID=106335 RepID=A0A6A2YR79_HIBSY|nr:L10-interacting MYB domain-containing protein-like [Hibiscus syriacus]XP_039024854.1 L10-interacting MYB domain-containing protein-like [Hibiscus syriacus]XP_039024855.1 L10-interacting MYB domain-containing protein-like [Hibiscus syriacus]KAE8681941.1 two-component response regulator ARR2-like [Hibiscus syriacus]